VNSALGSILGASLTPHQKNSSSGILLVYRLAARDLPPSGSATRAQVGLFKICFELAHSLTHVLHNISNKSKHN